MSALLAALVASSAIPLKAQEQPSQAPEVIAVKPEAGPADPLPDRLAGVRAVGTATLYSAEQLADLVGDQAPIFHEYLVDQATVRRYGPVRVELFRARHPFAAFGLFSFVSGGQDATRVETDGESGRARVGEAFVVWKGRFMVRASTVSGPSGSSRARALQEKLALSVQRTIPLPTEKAGLPPLLESLPVSAEMVSRKRYFLGPKALSGYMPGAGELFRFEGDTEAVMAEYRQTPDAVEGDGLSADSDTADAAAPLQFLIVEYHTPQFAHRAMGQLETSLASMPDQEKDRLVVKRVGNFIVQAANVENRGLADSLVGSIEYPYTVKWLRDPLLPTDDPWRQHKAVEMLMSTFGILGLILITVLVAGTLFGTTVFYMRRKRQRETFSDAGGMLRLDLDPFDAVLLGLPPKERDNGRDG